MSHAFSDDEHGRADQLHLGRDRHAEAKLFDLFSRKTLEGETIDSFIFQEIWNGVITNIIELMGNSQKVTRKQNFSISLPGKPFKQNRFIYVLRIVKWRNGQVEMDKSKWTCRNGQVEIDKSEHTNGQVGTYKWTSRNLFLSFNVCHCSIKWVFNGNLTISANLKNRLWANLEWNKFMFLSIL